MVKAGHNSVLRRGKTMPKQSKSAWVLYHSHSGNTKKLADVAASLLAGSGWQVTCQSLKDFSPKTGAPDLLVLGTPVHFWRIPEPALRMIRRLPRQDGVNAFVFCTYGNVFAGDSLSYLEKEMSALGAKVIGAASVVAPHNFMTKGPARLGDADELFGKGQPDEKTLELFKRAVAYTAKRGMDGWGNAVAPDQLLSPQRAVCLMDKAMPLSLKMKALAPVRFDASKCTDCGLCLKACDTYAVVRMDAKEKVIDRQRCTLCYACARACPTGALSVNWRQNELFLRGAKKMVKDTGPRVVF